MQLSVIIPCFNAGSALSLCADSLRRAALPGETQLVFVDDASTDGAFQALETNFGNTENALFLHHTHRRGVSASRNTGLDAATGQFIAFCDADDIVDDAIFQKLLAAIADADLAACAMSREATRKNDLCALPAVSSAKELLARSLPSPQFNSVCNKLYRKAKIDALHLRFNEASEAMEDTLFNVRYLIDSQHISVIQDAFYHYLAHDFSATSRETADKAKSSVAAAQTIAEMLQNDDVLSAARCRILTDALMTTLRADGFTLDETQAILKRLPEKFWRDARFGIVKQSILHLAAYAPHLARRLVRCLRKK